MCSLYATRWSGRQTLGELRALHVISGAQSATLKSPGELKTPIPALVTEHVFLGHRPRTRGLLAGAAPARDDLHDSSAWSMVSWPGIGWRSSSCSRFRLARASSRHSLMARPSVHGGCLPDR